MKIHKKKEYKIIKERKKNHKRYHLFLRVDFTPFSVRAGRWKQEEGAGEGEEEEERMEDGGRRGWRKERITGAKGEM